MLTDMNTFYCTLILGSIYLYSITLLNLIKFVVI